MRETVQTGFLLLTVIFLLSGCEMRNPPDWVVYHTDDDGIYLYDRANIEKDKKRPIVKVWDGALLSDAYRKDTIQPKTKDGSLGCGQES